jgi:hypothetical protein
VRRGLAPLALALAFTAGSAFAGPRIDPDKVERDAAQVIRENDAFCTHPSRPLSVRARATCNSARELAHCEGLRAACDAERKSLEDAPKETPNLLSEPFRAALSVVARALVWVVLAAVILAILIPLLSTLRRRRKESALAEKTEPTATPVAAPAPTEELLSDDDAETLLARAAEHARNGNLEGAIFSYLNAALRALDRRGAIRIARHRTNGEYVRGCKDAEAREPLHSIVYEVDRVQFGGTPATPDMVSRAAAHATELVRKGAMVTMALMLLFGTGCGGSFGSKRPYSDPAGHDVFEETMRRQGLTVSTLQTSLATLPLPPPSAKPGEEAPAVLVDTDRTILETTTETHLIEWVEAGGFLILAGSPMNWPGEIGALAETSTSTDIVTDRYSDDDDDDEGPTYHGKGLEPASVRFSDDDSLVLAHTGDGKVYAALRTIKGGQVLAIASSDLLTNVELARPGNASTIAAIMTSVDRKELRVARDEDGITPVSNPITALERAGLGLAFYHALAAALVLFVAVGRRMARPRPSPPPARRAFTEHVEATGNLYRRSEAAAHALAAYARYAEERVRQRLPRGNADPVPWLSHRSGIPVEECARVWQRATQARTQTASSGDELLVLKRLSTIVSSALRMD